MIYNFTIYTKSHPSLRPLYIMEHIIITVIALALSLILKEAYLSLQLRLGLGLEPELELECGLELGLRQPALFLLGFQPPLLLVEAEYWSVTASALSHVTDVHAACAQIAVA